MSANTVKPDDRGKVLFASMFSLMMI